MTKNFEVNSAMSYKYILISVIMFLMILSPVSAAIEKPVASFTANTTSGNAPLVVLFNDQSIGQNVRYDWNFGDGNTYQSRFAVHTYTKTGNFTATLRVSNGAGSSTYSQNITIPAYDPATTAPRAFISAKNPNGKAPYTVYFTDNSQGSPTAWLWVFADGYVSTDKNPNHTFIKKGRYIVSVREWNSKGYSAGKLVGDVIIT